MTHTGKRDDNGLLAKRVSVRVNRVVINGTITICTSEVWRLGHSVAGSVQRDFRQFKFLKSFFHFLRVFAFLRNLHKV